MDKILKLKYIPSTILVFSTASSQIHGMSQPLVSFLNPYSQKTLQSILTLGHSSSAVTTSKSKL